jgi:hypothetical protein
MALFLFVLVFFEKFQKKGKNMSNFITHIGKMVYFGPPLIDKMLSMNTHFMNNVGIVDGSQETSYL